MEQRFYMETATIMLQRLWEHEREQPHGYSTKGPQQNKPDNKFKQAELYAIPAVLIYEILESIEESPLSL